MVRPKNQEDLLKKRTETGNQVVNEIGHLLQRFEKRLTLSNLRFAERYDHMELHILIHFGIRGISEEYVAFLQREGSYLGRDKSGPLYGVQIAGKCFPEALPQCWRHAVSLMRASNCNQQAVLVDIIKFTETPERVIPTFVWFDRIDSVYRVLPQTMYFSESFGHVFRGVPEDRKHNVTVRGNIRPSDKCQLVDQVIEGTPEIMKNISCDRGKDRGHLLNGGTGSLDIIKHLSGLRVLLGTDFYRIGYEKPEEFSLQLKDVLFGPFDFYPNESNAVLGS